MAAKIDEGWQAGKTLIECMKFMLDNDIADVTFKLPPEKGK